MTSQSKYSLGDNKLKALRSFASTTQSDKLFQSFTTPTPNKFFLTFSLLRCFYSYGVKVRLPHALVMTFLFKDGSLKDKFRAILEATFTHSKNLATFVFIYKSLTNLMAHLQSQRYQIHSFIAAFIGGYLVFGKYNKVNEQINLYLLSRILYGLAKMAVKRGYIPEPKGDAFRWFGAIVWGIVLWQFEYEKDTLQPSLRSSMTYLYHDSNYWKSFTNFLIYNK